VAGKSNVAAEVIFDGTSLTWTAPGFVPTVEGTAPLTLPRSNPNNVMFRNESGGEARLVIGMNPRLDDDGQPLGPERICTVARQGGRRPVPHPDLRPAELRHRRGLRVLRARHGCHARSGRPVIRGIPCTHRRKYGLRPMSERPSTPRRLAHTARLALLGAGVLALSACAQDAPQDTWAPAGENAQKIHDLQWPIFLVAGIVGVIVMVVVLFAVIKFKDRGQPIPEQSHGNPIIEYTFIALPAAILAVIAGFTVNTIFDLAETQDTECVINVTGQQWWWEYDYPVDADGRSAASPPRNGAAVPLITSGQVVIPTDTKVLIRGTSRDVIHSFWIPKLNGKRDMVPGRVHTWRFHADSPASTPVSAPSSAVSATPTCAWRCRPRSADFQAWLDNQLEPYQSPEAGHARRAGETTYVSSALGATRSTGWSTPTAIRS
jgi:heme/copper-type cytochrome/quinol oxidase subunit 2